MGGNYGILGYTYKETEINTLLKGLSGFVGDIFKDIPEGVKVLTEFVWKVRWFLLMGWVSWLVVGVVSQLVPYVMTVLLIKSAGPVVGSLMSLFL